MNSPILKKHLKIILTLIYTVLCMAMTIVAAYPLTKPNLQGRKTIMFLIVFTMFFI